MRRFVSVFFAALLLAATAAAGCSSAAAAETVGFERSELFVVSGQAKHRFRVELALSSDQRALGLQHRPFLAEDAGMLFVYEQPGLIGMWMLNTLIPLDMIFIGANGRIVNIAERTTPKSLETIASAGPAVGVLEVLGGTARRLGLRPGDEVVHPLLGKAGQGR